MALVLMIFRNSPEQAPSRGEIAGPAGTVGTNPGFLRVELIAQGGGLDRGDLGGLAVWKRILVAIEEIGRTDPADDEPRH